MLRVWVHHFEVIEGQLRFRSDDTIPKAAKMICSPYDVDATYGRKVPTWWIGDKVHLTESCDDDAPRLIAHVQTSRAGNGDGDVTPLLHQALKEKDLLPQEHLTDPNYAEAKQFVQSQREEGIDLIAPTRADHQWQAKEQHGFDAGSFQIDWDQHHMTCPAGRESLSWTPAIDRREKEVIKIKFSIKDCRACQMKSHGTTAPRRTVTLRSQEHHQAVQRVRARQQEGAFWELYRVRAGIEGTLSEGASEPSVCAGVALVVWRKPISSTSLVPPLSMSSELWLA